MGPKCAPGLDLTTTTTLPPAPGSSPPQEPRKSDGDTKGLGKRLHVSKLTRNVTEEHLREIFSTYGTLIHCELAIDERYQLPKGYAIIEYDTQAQADAAHEYMNEGQLDGNII
jgi:RNA recognition motif-containing protein